MARITPKSPQEKNLGGGEIINHRIAPWTERWEIGRTQFHLDDVHHVLKQYLNELTGGRNSLRILVPLCGKSEDLKFLASEKRLDSQAHVVFGVDGVALAADQLEQEQGGSITYARVIQCAPGAEVRGISFGPDWMINFVLADYFSIGPEFGLGQFDACWDRGSLVAIDPADREQYVQVTSSLLSPGARILLVTVEHGPFSGGKLGPPFSIQEDEVHRLYQDDFTVTLLGREDRMEKEPAWTERGCGWFNEAAYALQKH